MMEPEECTSDMYGCAVIAPGETIKLVMSGPLSGSDASIGQDNLNGAILAAMNAGEFEGHTFEAVGEDDGGAGEGAAAVANRVVVDPTVIGVVGCLYSGASRGSMPIYGDAGYVMVSPSATAIDLTQMGSPVFNRVVFSDASQGRLGAEVLYNDLEVRTLAIVHDGQPYGQGLAEVVQDVFTELGGEVVAFEAINPGESDYSGVATALGALSPDAVYYGGYAAEAAVLRNNMAAAGLGDAILFGGDGLYQQTMLDLAGENAEGVYMTSSSLPPESPEKEAFDAQHLEEFGIPTGQLASYSWYAYDAANIIIEAVKSLAIVGDDGTLYVPRGALAETVRATSGFPGITGDITCDENGDCNQIGPALYRVEDGAFVQQP
jgi:branched-chain amino acid transport system substrate-binding protein